MKHQQISDTLAYSILFILSELQQEPAVAPIGEANDNLYIRILCRKLRQLEREAVIEKHIIEAMIK